MPDDDRLLDGLDRGFAYLAAVIQHGDPETPAMEREKAVREAASEHYLYLRSLRPRTTPFDEEYARLREEAVTVPPQHPNGEAFLEEVRAEAAANTAERKMDKIARAHAVGELDAEEMEKAKNERLAGDEDYDPFKAIREQKEAADGN